jgi:hypothetical protein
VILIDTSLREGLARLHDWQFETCDAVNGKRAGKRLPLAEGPYEWCVSLAQVLIDAKMDVGAISRF